MGAIAARRKAITLVMEAIAARRKAVTLVMQAIAGYYSRLMCAGADAFHPS